MQSAESNAQSNLNKRRDIALEKREAKLEKDEAKKYQNLKEELVIVIYCFRILFIFRQTKIMNCI